MVNRKTAGLIRLAVLILLMISFSASAWASVMVKWGYRGGITPADDIVWVDSEPPLTTSLEIGGFDKDMQNFYLAGGMFTISSTTAGTFTGQAEVSVSVTAPPGVVMNNANSAVMSCTAVGAACAFDILVVPNPHRFEVWDPGLYPNPWAINTGSNEVYVHNLVLGPSLTPEQEARTEFGVMFAFVLVDVEDFVLDTSDILTMLNYGHNGSTPTGVLVEFSTKGDPAVRRFDELPAGTYTIQAAVRVTGSLDETP